jgi:uncharacterized membrane protein
MSILNGYTGMISDAGTPFYPILAQSFRAGCGLWQGVVRLRRTHGEIIMNDLEAKQTARTEAFSDGVIAIVITLLAFELRVPGEDATAQAGGLLPALAQNWATYLSFVISFVTVLIMWVNHHRMFTIITRTDQNFLILNGLLLMGITLVPFANKLVSDYIDTDQAALSLMIYNVLFAFIAVFYLLVWNYATKKRRLVTNSVPDAYIKAIDDKFWMGPLIWLAAGALGFVHIVLGVMAVLLLLVYFAMRDFSLMRSN